MSSGLQADDELVVEQGEGLATLRLNAFSRGMLRRFEAETPRLVSRLYPAETFAVDARAFAQSMARTPRSAQLTKRLLRLEEAEAFARFLDAEAQAQAEAFQSDDFKEGVAAFRDKRAVLFQGR